MKVFRLAKMLRKGELNMKSKIFVILIVLVSIGTAAWSSMGQSQRGGRVSFEHMVIADPTDNQPEQGLKNSTSLVLRDGNLQALGRKVPTTRESYILRGLKGSRFRE